VQAGKHHRSLKEAVELQDLPCWHSDPCRHTKQTKPKKTFSQIASGKLKV